MLDVQTLVARVITRAPSLDEVLQAEGRSITLSVATFQASAGSESTEASFRLGELTLCNVRNIKMDSDDRQFSFEGDHVFSYEHTSYNQSSTRSERTMYRVIVRWTYNRSDYSKAYLLQIW